MKKSKTIMLLCFDAHLEMELFLRYDVAFVVAAIVQWIEQGPPKSQMQVRFLLGAPKSMVGL
jgi:hypothetical protein